MQNHFTHNDSTKAEWIVMKFGGSSVAEAKHWKTIANQVEICLSKGLKPLLVLSALKNVSNLLEALLHQALAGVHPNAIEHLKQHHLSFSAQLGLDIIDQLNPWFKLLESGCEQIYQTKKITPQLHASVLSVGELLSSTIGSEYLRNHFKASIDSNFWLDARKVLTTCKSTALNVEQTDDLWHHYTSAKCDFQYDASLSDYLSTKYYQVVVTQGFIASDFADNTVLLGREGSDTSAAYFGALLQACEIQIWTDVPGVFSCNPKDNSQALQLTELNYSDAKQMAKFGAKVLHPRAVQPACDNLIPLYIKSTNLPSEPGTRIDNQFYPSPKIKAVVNESKVIHVKYKASSEEYFDNTNHHLQSLGFDLILKQENKSNTRSLIYRYNNSDKVEPDACSLLNLIKQNMNSCAIELQSGMSLLSIIGIESDIEWQTAVIDFCKQNKLEPDECFSNQQQGRMNYLIVNNKLSDCERALHKIFIEANAGAFGKPWLSFL
jgi:diaminopimelate decarboxylase/aspartate kinase